jgi:hypothetical protein
MTTGTRKGSRTQTIAMPPELKITKNILLKENKLA